METNLILDTDSYKASHWLQYPPGTEGMYSYFESRGGRWGETVFFGLQYLLKEYLSKPVTAADVEEAKAFFEAHGEPFNYDGWMGIVRDHDGYMPVRIKAVPEGTVVPTHNILMSVESTDPKYFWIVSWLETVLVRLWYSTTVATQSHYIKRRILAALNESANDPAGEVAFKLHDFGSRGVSSRESAGIGGMAHLCNFMGSDTVEGVRFANRYYGCKGGMAAFSIPAAEHSTITMWGRAHEVDAYRNMIKQYGGKGKLVACVSDSWDVFNAVENLWCDELREEVEATGGTLVIRPDSGDPAEVVLKLLQILDRKVPMERNTRGFKVLPSYLRIIQGDGVDEDSIQRILAMMLQHGYSASNIAFGCGGALLQRLDRDTQKFAFKCSSATINGAEVEVYKDPITDQGKKSKRGRLSLVKRDGRFCTVEGGAKDDILRTVFENGKILVETTLDEVRARADAGLR
jgi:nicotinamide phosphoribosyltransferase